MRLIPEERTGSEEGIGGAKKWGKKSVRKIKETKIKGTVLF